MTDSWRSWWGSLTEAGWAMGVSSCCPPLPGSGPGTVLRVDCSLPVWMSFVSHQLEAPAVPPVEDQVLLPQAWKSVWNIHKFQSLLPSARRAPPMPWHVLFTAFCRRYQEPHTSPSSASLSRSLQSCNMLDLPVIVLVCKLNL